MTPVRQAGGGRCQHYGADTRVRGPPKQCECVGEREETDPVGGPAEARQQSDRATARLRTPDMCERACAVELRIVGCVDAPDRAWVG